MFQRLLFSLNLPNRIFESFFSKTVKIKTFKTICFLVVLYMCETQTLVLRKQHIY